MSKNRQTGSLQLLLQAPFVPPKSLAVENKHDIKKVAKLLNRTEEACYEKLSRLGIRIKNVRNSTYVIFPKPDADLRRELVKKLMPKLMRVLDKRLKEKDLKPEHYDYLIRLIRASASMFRALEAWQTGALEIEFWSSYICFFTRVWKFSKNRLVL